MNSKFLASGTVPIQIIIFTVESDDDKALMERMFPGRGHEFRFFAEAYVMKRNPVTAPPYGYPLDIGHGATIEAAIAEVCAIIGARPEAVQVEPTQHKEESA